MNIILGSQSPRRRELLAGLNIPFEAITIDVEEVYPPSLPAAQVPEYLAQLKASAYADSLEPDTLLITADTVVVLQDQILGKPRNAQDARHMIDMLSGCMHQVITGVCLTTNEYSRTFSSTTQVTFAELTPAEIDFYVEQYRPMDKAGSYGIQEWIGYIGITHISGSYFNVMGLPVQRLYRELKKLNIIQ